MPRRQVQVGEGGRTLGNLRPTSDFRGVYRTLLEDWLNVDADPIIPGASGFEKYALVA